MSHILFVYGTLKRGFPNHSVLGDNAKFIDHATASPEFSMISMGGFPGMFREEAGQLGPVIGELWSVDDEGLQSCDTLEGHPRFYRRTKIKAFPAGGKPPIDCETYLLPDQYSKETKPRINLWSLHRHLK